MTTPNYELVGATSDEVAELGTAVSRLFQEYDMEVIVEVVALLTVVLARLGANTSAEVREKANALHEIVCAMIRTEKVTGAEKAVH